MSSNTSTARARKARRSTRRLHKADPTQAKGIGASNVGTVKQLLIQLRSDMAGGHPVDPSALDRLALGAAIDGKLSTAQFLATLANGQRLEDLLSELETRDV
jgi:hypothetical protein